MGTASAADGGPQAADPYRRAEASERARRLEDHDRLAGERDAWRARNRPYYDGIERLARFVVPEGASVLEVGSGTGDLLAALRPGAGVGLELSPRLVEIARRKHPGLQFVVGDVEELDGPGAPAELRGRTFDYIVLSDVVGALFDVWQAFRALRRMCTPRTRLLVTYYNFVWEPLLKFGERIGKKMPIAQQNWLGMQDLANLLELNHFEIIRRGTAQLCPSTCLS